MWEMDARNAANLLGALALFVTDTITDALEREPGAGFAAALSLLHAFPALSVEELRRPLALSHSGCVRLVDRLEQEGLLERRAAAADARAVALHLTRKGSAAATRALAAREAALVDALAALTAVERETFGRLATKLLDRNVVRVPTAVRTCRLCDHEACASCPMSKFLDADHG